MGKLKDIEVENKKNSEFLKLLHRLHDDAEKNEDRRYFFWMFLKIIVERFLDVQNCLCDYVPSRDVVLQKDMDLGETFTKITISRYLGPFNGTSELIKERLQAEIANLKNPTERVCSLVTDVHTRKIVL